MQEAKSASSNWLEINNKMSLDAVLYQQKNIQSEVNFILRQTEHDELNYSHHRYQITKLGYPIEGAQLILHEKDNNILSFNGATQVFSNRLPLISFNPESALGFAMANRAAKLYAWEVESEIPELNQNLPIPELCWVNADFDLNKELILCYKIDLFSYQPYKREWVYIDAMTGDQIASLNRICDINVEGTAYTKYIGIQKIITDSVEAKKFLLQDFTRGNGIVTLNSKNQSDLAKAVDFTDTDNIWNNVNLQKDEIATDAHFGAAKTYDYFLQLHNRRSVDNKDLKLISLVHYSTNFANATWNGTTMNYGDGDNNFKPFTFLDICGHEISHGFTEFTSNLIYLRESGALNESISDIFGMAIYNWALNKQKLEWLLAKGIYISDSNKAIRSMSNPNIYQNPKYYKGRYWISNNSDNGGVHTNSGVLNYWFYLLSEGIAGKNEAGLSFNVDSLGIESAAKIVYRMNTVYLTPLSNYYDAYYASLKATEDLFGSCSKEIKAVQMAWAAVGVTYNTGETNDLYTYYERNLFSSCDLAKGESIAYQLINGSCDKIIPKGAKIKIGATMNKISIYSDSLILSNDINPNDSITIDLKNILNFDTVGKYNILVFSKIENDTINGNDTIKLNIEKLDRTQVDYSLAAPSVGPFSLGCTDSGPLTGRLRWKSDACDPIAVGSKIPIGIISNNATESEGEILVERIMYNGDSAYVPFSVDLTGVLQFGTTQYYIYLKNPNDIKRSNDTIKVTLSKKYELPKDVLLTFNELTSSKDSVNLIFNSNSTCAISPTRSISGDLSVRMSGGSPQNPNYSYTPPLTQNDIWTNNPLSKSKLCICANAEGMNNVKLKFDRKHNIANTLTFLIQKKNINFLSALRVLVNGVQASKTYLINYPSDTLLNFSEALDLSPYKGTKFELCFETYTGVEATSDNSKRIGDAVWLDNIILVDEVTVSNTDVKKTNSNYSIRTNPIHEDKLILESSESKDFNYVIFNEAGQKIIVQDKCFIDNNTLYQIETKKLNQGIYYLKINDKQSSQTLKFIKN